MKPLYVIRHWTTSLNWGWRIRGWINVPLSPKGISEVRDQKDNEHLPYLDGFISSDLVRAHQTAKILSEMTGIPVISTTKGLRPWHLGILTGKSVEETLPFIQDHIKNPDKPILWGESFNEFKHRFLSEIEAILENHPEKDIGIVTHHRGERLLNAWHNMGRPDDHSINEDDMMEEWEAPGSIQVIN